MSVGHAGEQRPRARRGASVSGLLLPLPLQLHRGALLPSSSAASGVMVVQRPGGGEEAVDRGLEVLGERLAALPLALALLLSLSLLLLPLLLALSLLVAGLRRAQQRRGASHGAAAPRGRAGALFVLSLVVVVVVSSVVAPPVSSSSSDSAVAANSISISSGGQRLRERKDRTQPLQVLLPALPYPSGVRAPLRGPAPGVSAEKARQLRQTVDAFLSVRRAADLVLCPPVRFGVGEADLVLKSQGKVGAVGLGGACGGGAVG